MEGRCSVCVVTQCKFGQHVSSVHYYTFFLKDFARYGFGHQAQETEVYLSFKEAAKGATKALYFKMTTAHPCL